MTGSRRGLFWVTLVVIVIVGFAIVGRGDERSAEPLAPDSTSGSGLRALVLLAEAFGADVDVIDGAPTADRTVAFMPTDRFGRSDTAAMRRWVRSGGILVVTDPQSSFVPNLGGPLGTGLLQTSTLDDGDCTIGALSNAETVSVDSAFMYRPPSSSTRCSPSAATR